MFGIRRLLIQLWTVALLTPVSFAALVGPPTLFIAMRTWLLKEVVNIFILNKNKSNSYQRLVYIYFNFLPNI